MSDDNQIATPQSQEPRERLHRFRRDLPPLVHDIIVTTGELIAEEEAQGDTSVLADLQSIDGAARRLLVMIAEILDPGSIDAGTVELRWARHELRTPLTHVLGYSEMLLEDAAALSSEGIAAGIRRITDTADACLECLS